VEEFLSTTAVACEFLFGQPLNAVCVHVAYPKPDHAEKYSNIIRCPVLFDSENTVLILGRELMDLPTVTGHFRMKHHCENLCQELMAKLSRADKMIGLIRQHVIQSMGRFPKAEDMAHQLSMSPRTFYRRLSERNTSYQAILDEVRAELAMSYLEHTHLSVDQISDLIGFTETTTFRRAFKKWTGYSPSEFRKKEINQMPFQ
jgi:AraC-like DNA-binding protein